LRGDESDGDERFAMRMAEKYALPLEISRVDVKALAAEQKLSLEEAGRNVRRTFFRDICEKHSAVAVALGHHRDDQAETVLMRLIRGAAGSGMTGMQPKSPGNLIVRPLLCLSRAEIEAYLRKGLLQWREDSSNSDNKFMRNRIRNELLPLLRSYNPEITVCLSQTAQALAADEELLEAIVTRALQGIAITSPYEVSLNLEILQHEPEAIRKRLYRRAILMLQGDLRRISAQHLADIDILASGKKGSGKLSLPAGVIVIRKYVSMTLRNIPEQDINDNPELTVNSCGSYQLNADQTIVIEKLNALPINWLDSGTDTIFVDSSQIPFPWIIRCCREGDRFTPFGMEGSKKLKNLFIDKKIPRAVRKTIPLLLCREDIFWVGGVQTAEKIRINESAGNLLRLRLISTSTSDRH
jgi:tRNA(Ile)-lysidine synthase